jgi:integrase
MTEVPPTTANRTLPLRRPNAAYRPREYLTETEVDRLIDAARNRGRNGERDACAILLAYRHGRAAELCTLRWSQVDLQHGRLHVNRAKGGAESVHPLHGPELRALCPLRGTSPYVFRDRSWHARHHCVVLVDGRAHRSCCEATIRRAPAHAAARLWVQAGILTQPVAVSACSSFSSEPLISRSPSVGTS